VLAPDAVLPPGLGIHADGEDVGGKKELGAPDDLPRRGHDRGRVQHPGCWT